MGTGIGVDSFGNSYITGFTSSNNFPTKNAFNSTYGGSDDVFLAKFDSSGHLLFSTFFGGSGFDYGTGIAVDSLGNSYITGRTSSNNFPAKNAFNSTYGGGTFNAFVAEFNSSGGLLYSTFLGGNGDDSGSVISVDTNGSYYITGTTQSADFPTENVFNATYSGYSNVFLSKFDSQNNLVFSTYLGGEYSEGVHSISIDSFDNCIITGETGSSNFPTLNAFDTREQNFILGGLI